MAPANEAAATAAPAAGLRTSAAWRDRRNVTTTVAVIVHFGDAAQTRACAASLHQHAHDVLVLIVDNDGNPTPQAALLELLDDTKPAALLVAGSNRGFGAGCNLGLVAALAQCPALQHVLLLNPDAVATAGMVPRLCAAAAAHPDAGIVGGRVLATDGHTVQFANGRLRPWTLARMHCEAPRDDAPFATTFVTGALMLLAADLLRDGLRFDERFFLYVEDLDLCCEVRARGRSLCIEPRAVALHRGGGCWGAAPRVLGGLTAGQVYWLARSKVWFARKRLTRAQRAVQFVLATFAKPLLGLLSTRSVAFVGPYLRGLRDGWRDAGRPAR